MRSSGGDSQLIRRASMADTPPAKEQCGQRGRHTHIAASVPPANHRLPYTRAKKSPGREGRANKRRGARLYTAFLAGGIDRLSGFLPFDKLLFKPEHKKNVRPRKGGRLENS